MLSSNKKVIVNGFIKTLLIVKYKDFIKMIGIKDKKNF